MFIGELNDIIRESLIYVNYMPYSIGYNQGIPQKRNNIDSQTNEQSNELQVFKIRALSDFE